MTLRETINTNNGILHLIASKHVGPPSLWPNSIELRYYNRLTRETDDALKLLNQRLHPIPWTAAARVPHR